MATVNAVVYEQYKKEDGTYNVKIRLFHQSVRRLIDTVHYVSSRQLDKNFKIKDKVILRAVDETLDDYRQSFSRLGTKLEFFTCDDLRNYLIYKNNEIDFIKFCQSHVDQLKKDNREGTAKNHQKIKNSLVDYFKKSAVSITEINSNMLYSYERFLLSERYMVRINQLGKLVRITEMVYLPEVCIVICVI
jgi:hypothetical protein